MLASFSCSILTWGFILSEEIVVCMCGVMCWFERNFLKYL